MPYNERSKNVTQGVARSPNRAMYYAMGYKDEDFDKPMVGVANGHSTITPCNSGLQRLADAAIAEIAKCGANSQAQGRLHPSRPAKGPVGPVGGRRRRAIFESIRRFFVRF